MKMKRIDKNLPIPAYHQLKEIIRENIKDGKWSPGTRIPSEPELSKLNHISQMTVRQAMTELCNEGLLYRIKGKGTFTAKRELERDLGKLTYFPKKIGKKGSDITTTVFNSGIIPASKEISLALEIVERNPVVAIERLRKMDGIPFYIETSYIPFHMCPELITGDLEVHSLHFVLEKTFGFVMDHATVSIEAVAADKRQCTLLELKKNTPLLKMSQVTYLREGGPIQYLEAVSRSDKFKYTLVRRKRG